MLGFISSSFTATLRERLDAIDAEVAELDRRRELLLKHKDTIEALMAQEKTLSALENVQLAAKSLTTGPPILGTPQPTPNEPSLSVWIVKALRSGARDLDDLKRVLANAPALKEHQSPGRAINFALVGLQRGGHVDRLDNGKWVLSSAESQKEKRDHPAIAG